MMAKRSKLRLIFRHTAKELRKWSKTRLIRLILRLEAARVSRIGLRRKSKTSRSAGSKRKLSPGVHNVRFKNGKTRRVRVLKNGRWRFLKGKAHRSSRTRRRKRTTRRTTRRRRR